jgi:tRNA-dihydrouridine synthase B
MFPTEFHIRNLQIQPNVVLAPMEGVTDLPFRRLVRHIGGVGLTCTEFIAASALKLGRGKMWETAQFDTDERPISVQIYGKNPQEMADAARVVQDMGADICDINMGCPSKKVCAHSGGSALMREPTLAIDIVKAVRGAIQIPLTVKMRSGFDHANRNADELAYRCQEEGAEAVTIHWRTREDRYSGLRQIDRIAAAVDRLRIPVVGNGDIIDLASAKAMFTDTGCAGIMIGRGAIRNPWLALQISRWQMGMPDLKVGSEEKKRIMLRYFDAIYTRLDQHEKGTMGRMKMLAKHFTIDLPHGKAFQGHLLHAQSRQEMLDWVDSYFLSLEQFESGDSEAFSGTAFLEVPPRKARNKAKSQNADPATSNGSGYPCDPQPV